MMRSERLRRGGKLTLAAIALAVLLAGCGIVPPNGGKTSQGGGYYKDDGPPQASPPTDLDLVPDPLPRVEPLASGANKPYVIFGKRYVPDTSMQPYKMRGVASWYGRKFHGARTSNGEIYDMYAMSAAHTTMPIPSYARVTRTATGKSVLVRVNDRGPFHDDRIIDLSYAAAYRLGIIEQGSAEVVVERLLPDEIARIRADRNGEPDQAVASAPVLPPQSMPPNPAGASGAVATAVPVASTIPVAAALPAPPMRELAPPPSQASSASQASPSYPPSQTPPSQTPSSQSQPSQPPPSPAGSGTPWPATAASAPPPSGTASAAPGIYLQLGAFSVRPNAEALLATVRAKLGNWTEALGIVNTGNLNRVQVGPYASRESALTAARTLQERTAIAPIVVTR